MRSAREVHKQLIRKIREIKEKVSEIKKKISEIKEKVRAVLKLFWDCPYFMLLIVHPISAFLSSLQFFHDIFHEDSAAIPYHEDTA